MKARLIYLSICSLLVAGIVHIIIILLIPSLGSKDAAKQIDSKLNTMRFYPIGDGSEFGISNNDPFLKLAVCKFDLTNTAVQINGQQTKTFWSASVFDERGRVIYSMNDRTAIKNQLRIIIVNPIQMADIRQTQPEEIETSILVESQNMKGFVLLRAFVPDASWNSLTDSFLGAAECTPYNTNLAISPDA